MARHSVRVLFRPHAADAPMDFHAAAVVGGSPMLDAGGSNAKTLADWLGDDLVARSELHLSPDGRLEGVRFFPSGQDGIRIEQPVEPLTNEDIDSHPFYAEIFTEFGRRLTNAQPADEGARLLLSLLREQWRSWISPEEHSLGLHPAQGFWFKFVDPETSRWRALWCWGYLPDPLSPGLPVRLCDNLDCSTLFLQRGVADASRIRCPHCSKGRALQPLASQPTSTPTPGMGRKAPRSFAPWIVAAAVLLLLGIIGFWVLKGEGGSRDPDMTKVDESKSGDPLNADKDNDNAAWDQPNTTAKDSPSTSVAANSSQSGRKDGSDTSDPPAWDTGQAVSKLDPEGSSKSNPRPPSEARKNASQVEPAKNGDRTVAMGNSTSEDDHKTGNGDSTSSQTSGSKRSTEEQPSEKRESDSSATSKKNGDSNKRQKDHSTLDTNAESLAKRGIEKNRKNQTKKSVASKTTGSGSRSNNEAAEEHGEDVVVFDEDPATDPTPKRKDDQRDASINKGANQTNRQKSAGATQTKAMKSNVTDKTQRTIDPSANESPRGAAIEKPLAGLKVRPLKPRFENGYVIPFLVEGKLSVDSRYRLVDPDDSSAASEWIAPKAAETGGLSVTIDGPPRERSKTDRYRFRLEEETGDKKKHSREFSIKLRENIDAELVDPEKDSP